MVKDFVRDGHAYLKCTECGAETTVIQYILVPGRPGEQWFPMVDMNETVNNISSFSYSHALCKCTTKQADLFANQ